MTSLLLSLSLLLTPLLPSSLIPSPLLSVLFSPLPTSPLFFSSNISVNLPDLHFPLWLSLPNTEAVYRIIDVTSWILVMQCSNTLPSTSAHFLPPIPVSLPFPPPALPTSSMAHILFSLFPLFSFSTPYLQYYQLFFHLSLGAVTYINNLLFLYQCKTYFEDEVSNCVWFSKMTLQAAICFMSVKCVLYF